MRRILLGLAIATLSAGISRADYAFVLTETICDNQYDSMNVEWFKQKHPSNGTLKLIYFDGSSFIPNAGQGDFNSYALVAISAHGNIGQIDGVSGQQFATKFKAAHASVPSDVYFMSCYSANPTQGLSNVGQVAAQYLKSDGKSTHVGKLSGTELACRLEQPGQPIDHLGEAVYRSGGSSTPAAQKLIEELLAGWVTDKYPQTQLSFKAYCQQMQRPRDLGGFVDNVYRQYGRKYIELINQNAGGNPAYECGAATSHPVCR